MKPVFELSQWSLIPGPADNSPASSLVLQNLIEYPPDLIAGTILNLPNTVERKPGNPTWWDWIAVWQETDERVEFAMTLFDTDPKSWGGSSLDGSCSPNQFLKLSEAIRMTCPGVWMHNDDCEIHTPATFRKLFEIENRTLA